MRRGGSVPSETGSRGASHNTGGGGRGAPKGLRGKGEIQ